MAASESIWFRSTPHPRTPPRPTLNGEGIDYGLETGRLVAELLADERHLGSGWPAILRRHYGEAFSIARRLAGLLTLPRLLPVAGPVGMRSRALMTVALRVMGNLVTGEESASGPPSAASRCTSNARWSSPMRARSLTPMSCRSGRCWCSGFGCRGR
jgi:hypothetical protein